MTLIERGRLVGVAAIGATIILWSSFALSARAIGGSGLATIDVTLLRFLPPVVLLLPWAPRAVREVRQERGPVLALLLVGGLPHFLLFALGAHLTSAGLTDLPDDLVRELRELGAW